jgi:hypothetical protein
MPGCSPRGPFKQVDHDGHRIASVARLAAQADIFDETPCQRRQCVPVGLEQTDQATGRFGTQSWHLMRVNNVTRRQGLEVPLFPLPCNRVAVGRGPHCLPHPSPTCQGIHQPGHVRPYRPYLYLKGSATVRPWPFCLSERALGHAIQHPTASPHLGYSSSRWCLGITSCGAVKGVRKASERSWRPLHEPAGRSRLRLPMPTKCPPACMSQESWLCEKRLKGSSGTLALRRAIANRVRVQPNEGRGLSSGTPPVPTPALKRSACYACKQGLLAASTSLQSSVCRTAPARWHGGRDSSHAPADTP